MPGVGNDPPPVYTVASLYPTVPAPATGGVNVGLLPPTGNPSAPARPQPPVVVISAQRQTIIGGHLPVEVDCDKCHVSYSWISGGGGRMGESSFRRTS